MADKYGLEHNFNKNWRDNWFEIISTDHDYDGDYLIRIITHKVGLMLKHFSEQLLEGIDDPQLSTAVLTMEEVNKLGIKILTYNYGIEADQVFYESGNSNWVINDDAVKDKWVEFTEEAMELRNEDIKKFFSLIGENINTWW